MRNKYVLLYERMEQGDEDGKGMKGKQGKLRVTERKIVIVNKEKM